MGIEKNIYLDNAAATPVDANVMDFFRYSCLKHYANQEASHDAGYAVRRELEKAAGKLLKTITGNPEKNCLFWTNSGTDSINAVLALPQFSQGNIITTKAEHPALLEAISRAAGPERTKFAEIGGDGGINFESLSNLIDEKTSLVALHHVQSETGRVQDLIKIREILNTKNSKALFFADTVQSAFKMELPWEKAGLDFALVSGHKMGAPSGGAVICRDRKLCEELKKTRDKRYLIARADPPSCLSLAFAAERFAAERDNIFEKAKELSNHLRNGLREIFKEATITVPEENSSPFIVHFTVKNCQGAVLVRMLSQEGLMISSGSACMAESPDASKTLLAMGMDKAKAFSALRVSFWKNTEIKDIDCFLDSLSKVLKNY
jgi:cysteine desulfurase